MASSIDTPVALKPSELGTKSYWDDCYRREIQNHASNPDDEGTIWFAETGAEEKMMQMLEDMAEAGSLAKEDAGDRKATSFIDLGTGNGHLLFSLRDDGWTGSMLGVDYSASSVVLAQQINGTRQESMQDALGNGSVTFSEYDILCGSDSLEAANVLLDKGTFDAISLSMINEATTRYRDSIKSLLLSNGYLIITSCNWTEKELRGWIEQDQSDSTSSFEFVDRVRYPSFRFGGHEGQSVVTLCFQLKTK